MGEISSTHSQSSTCEVESQLLQGRETTGLPPLDIQCITVTSLTCALVRVNLNVENYIMRYSHVHCVQKSWSPIAAL